MNGWGMVRDRARIADTIVAATAVLLAGASLVPLFLDLGWVAPAVLIVVLIAAVGAGGRALALPMPFIPLAQAAALLVALSALHAGSWTWARVVPTTRSWEAVQLLAQQGITDAQTYLAPVDTTAGVVLLASGAAGLVALATDTLFVSVRTPVLAGIPLATTYLATSALLPGRVPWWTFPLAATGWLLILAADQRDRVRDWGRLPSRTRVRGLSRDARRIGVVAVGLAAVVGVLVPAASGAPWSGGGDGSGGGTIVDGAPVLLDPLVSMRRNLVQANDTEVLSYQTLAERPSYLRVAALEVFDGTTWRARDDLAAGREAGVPLPGNVLSDLIAVDASNRVRGGDSYTYDVSVANLSNAFLPLPYPVSEVTDVDGLRSDWRLDPSTGIAFSDEIPATGLKYQVAALDPRIQPTQLRDAQSAGVAMDALLTLPSGLSPRIAELAADVTAAATTPYDKAVALQRWFTQDGGFRYDTNVRSGNDADYLAEFLDARVGYCEQFAGAMAVMARTLGIPSRVVVGFTQGSRAADGTWHVTVRDAHAWPELWFDGVGWARFEPTPRSGGTVQTPEYARAAVPVSGAGGAIDRRVPRDLDVVEQSASSDTSLGRLVGAITAGAVVVVLLVVAGLLARPMVARRWRRRARLRAGDGPVAVLGAWAELADVAVDLGQPWSLVSTPRQAADRLSRGMPEAAAAALDRLRQEVERTKYRDPHGVTAERAEAVRSDLVVVTDELRRRVPWHTRIAAYCWPSSERRRQRSSMRSMNPVDVDGLGAGPDASVSPTAASAGRAPKDE